MNKRISLQMKMYLISTMRVFTLFALVVNAVAFPMTSVQAQTPTTVGLITDEGGVNDMAFNWLAYQGLQQAESDLGIIGTLYDSASSDDYTLHLQQCAVDNDLCIAVGFLTADATVSAADVNPDTSFAILDYYVNDGSPANLRGIQFDIKQAGYLTGALAGKLGDVVGVVGGMEIPPVVGFVDGYRNGAQCANENVDVLVEYAGTFVDPVLGAQIAQNMIDQNANVIFGVAGPLGSDAILYSAQHDVWSIGVDTDQYLNVFGNGTVAGSDKLLTSAMKNLDYGVYQTIQDYINENFSSGTVTYTLADGGVGLAPYHETDASIPQSTKDYVDGVAANIINGNIDIDQTCRDEPLPNPSFSARITENQVHGYGWLLGSDVTLFVDGDEIDTQTVTEADWDPNQTFVWFDLGESLTLQAGQVIEMTDGNITKTHTVTNLEVTGVDVDGNTVSGTADEGTQVDIGHIYCDENGCIGFRREIANSNGEWVADFSEVGEDPDEQDIIDITPGMGNEARQCDEDGDCTQYGWHVPNPYIEAAPHNDWVHAREWALDALITMEIDDPSDGIGALDEDNNPVDFSETGTMAQAPWNPGDPNDIVADFRWPDQFAPGPGYVITMSGNGQSKMLTVSQLNMTDFDLDADTISGIGTPNTQIQVCANVPDRCITRWVTADGSGIWTANYGVPGTGNDDPETFDVQQGSNGWAAEYDGDSDSTWIDWNVADPRIEVSYEHDWIQIRDFTPGGDVTYTIFDYEGGHALFGPVTGPVDSHGNGWISSNLHHTDLIPGNYITAVNEATGEEVSILIRTLNLDYVDVVNDRAFGTAVPNSTIELHISETHDQGFSLTANVDNSGNWVVDLAAESHPIEGYRHASINLNDAEGDNIVAQPPRVHGEIRSDNMSVDNFSKNADVTLTLYDNLGGSVLYGPATLRTDGSGNAWVNLWQLGIDLIPGNYIVAHDHYLGFTKSLEVEPFAIDGMNTVDDSIYGTSAVGEWVELHVESLFSNWGLDALTDGTGHWTRNYGAEDYDITDQMWGNGWATDDQDNWSEDHTTGLPGLEASIAGDWISGFNFSPDRQVRIRIYDSESGNLLTDTYVTAWGNTQLQADYSQHGVDLQAGMFIRADDLETGKFSELTLVPLTFDGVNYDTDTAWGTAEAGTQVVVRANHLFDSYEMTVTADASNEWSVDFSSLADITPEWNLRAMVFDLEFDATVADAPQPPQFTASLSSDWINGNNWTPNNNVTVSIYESEGGSAIGSPFIWDTDNYGNFYADLRNEGIDLLPYNYITVTDNDSGVVKSLTLPNLTIDYLDPDLEVARGQAPADTRLSIDFNNQQENIQFDLFSEADGTWQADFAAHDFDLQPGSSGSIITFDNDGDGTQVEGYVPDPRFTVYPEWEAVEAWGWPNEATVTASVGGKSACTIDGQLGYPEWDPSTTNVWMDFPEGCDVTVGDVVTLTAEEMTPETHVVRNLSVTEVKVDADSVTGTADSGTVVYVWPHCCGQYEVQPTAVNDAWLADFAAVNFDLQPGTNGRSEVRDVNGNATAVDWRVLNPFLSVRLDGNTVTGYDWPLDTDITLTIDDPATTYASVDYFAMGQMAETPWGETIVYFELDDLYTVKPGDIVTMQGGGYASTHIVFDGLSFDSASVDDDTISGSATIGASIQVNQCDENNCADRYIEGTTAETWTVDFSVEGLRDDEKVLRDLQPGMSGEVWQFDEWGNSTVRSWYIPNPTFGVRVNYDGIEGWEWPLGVTVTIEIDDWTTSEDPEPQMATVGVADWDPNQTWFSLNIENYDLKTWDTVTVTDGNTTKELTITPFEITDFDLDTDKVYGVAGGNQYVNVWTCWQNDSCIGRDEMANGAGEWETNFAESGEQDWESETADLRAGSWIDSSVSDEDGDQIMFGVYVPFNQPPTDVVITAPNAPLTVYAPVTIQVDFADPDEGDTHTVEIDWGDSALAVIDTDGLTVTATHQYPFAGVYTILVTVTDAAGESVQATFQYVVIYDPDGAFVTGGGWFYDPDSGSKAYFGFNPKYHNNGTLKGETEFKLDEMKFKSTSHDWLVIIGTKAVLKGTGTINGTGEYKFILTAIDGSPDKFRIKIWDLVTGEVIYDNEPGADNIADPTTPIKGGSIVIHKAK